MNTHLRIGYGLDVHAFEAGDHVVLGGVTIPHTRGVKAHSDGDVLLHALCDALLGAAALGDIGVHFPDTDPRWKDVDSRVLLRHVRSLLSERAFAVVNVDVTVFAEAPRLGKHRDTMKKNIAADLAIDAERVNVKATTSEGLGYVGRVEGLACHAVALIERTDTI
jgi:2-C-methyl-D-erythritol 2,4-cyclodiphosphate synthase